MLDLPNYNGLISSLVKQKHTDDASEIVLSLCLDMDGISPSDDTFMPVVLSYIKASKYDEATKLLEAVKSRGVTLSTDSYDDLDDIYEDLMELPPSKDGIMFENAFTKYMENSNPYKLSENKILDLDEEDFDGSSNDDLDDDPPSRSL